MTCPSGKVPYSNQREARKQLTVMVRRRGIRGFDRMEVGAYDCPDCAAWHLTSWDQKPKRRRPPVPDDPPGTTYCEGCGHQTFLHSLEGCRGKRGKCQCTEAPPLYADRCKRHGNDPEPERIGRPVTTITRAASVCSSLRQ